MITVYTKNNCGFCMQAKNVLRNRDMQFEEVNIEENQEARDFILAEGHRTMPQLYKDGELFVEGGFQGLMSYLEKSDLDTTQLGSL